MIEFLQSVFEYTSWIQIFSLVSGVIYCLMQVVQHKWMWYFGLMTAGAALIVAIINFDSTGAWAPLWAQFILNSYFFLMDIVGIFSWRKIRSREGAQAVNIVKLERKSVLRYGAGLMILTPVICLIFAFTNDPDPVAEGISFGLSIVAQLMLTRSHIEQWFMWMAADIVAIIVYSGQGAWWMVGLYYCYILSAFFGVYYWRQHGAHLK